MLIVGSIHARQLLWKEDHKILRKCGVAIKGHKSVQDLKLHIIIVTYRINRKKKTVFHRNLEYINICSMNKRNALYDLLDLRYYGGLQSDIVTVQQVQPELIEEHLVPLLVSPVVLGVLLLDAVVGQVAGHILEV